MWHAFQTGRGNKKGSVPMPSFKRSTLLVFAAAIGSLSARAETLMGYGNWDTRSGGSFSVDASNSKDGNGSLKLSTTNALPVGGVNQDKVAVIFGTGGPLGTLGDLTGISLDSFKSSSPVTNPIADFAYRLQFANHDSLVYENAYNGMPDPIVNDVWRTLNITGGKFWLFDHITGNHNGGSDAHALSYYTGLQGQQISGLQIAYGSGLGAFSGNVDNIHLDFGAQNYYGPVVAASVAPLPTTAVVGAACFAILGIGSLSRRNRVVAA